MDDDEHRCEKKKPRVKGFTIEKRYGHEKEGA